MNVKINLKSDFHIVERVNTDTMESQSILPMVSTVFSLYRVLQSNTYQKDTYLLANNIGDYSIIEFEGKNAFVLDNSDIVAECIFPNK